MSHQGNHQSAPQAHAVQCVELGMRLPRIGVDSATVNVGIVDGVYDVPWFDVGHHIDSVNPGETWEQHLQWPRSHHQCRPRLRAAQGARGGRRRIRLHRGVSHRLVGRLQLHELVEAIPRA